MTKRAQWLCITLLATPALLPAQGTPVASAVRAMAKESGHNLLEAARVMPGGRYGYRPTAKQMSFAEIVAHIRHDNRTTCAAFSGLTAPAEKDPAATAGKDSLVAALDRSITFCNQALAKLDDAHLGETVSWYGGKTTRVTPALGLLMDWSDHYAQQAVYLRLNSVLPPTARKS